MGQKTERATPKRRRDAREKGNVLRSADLSAAVVLLAMFAALRVMGGYIIARFLDMLTNALSSEALLGTLQLGDTRVLLMKTLVSVALIGAPLLLVGALAALIANYMQVGFLLTGKPLMPKMERINPLEGFKRIFSIRSLAELVKAILKIAVLGYIAYTEYMGMASRFTNFLQQDFAAAAAAIADLTLGIAFKMCAALVILAAGDLFYQWWRRERDMRMSKQEIKDEMKLTEGDPQIKNRIRQKQRQMGMMRMMQAVPTANVVITNPTHYAVALRYQEGKDEAPIVVAKGKNLVAQRIKQEAAKHHVEMVENRPLAQALFFYCEVGDRIPRDMFKAVAEVLAHVYRLKHGMTRRERAAQ